MALNVDDVCSDGDLALRVSYKRLNQAQPDIAFRDSARAIGLNEVLVALEGRSPPVRESDLTNPIELRDAVRARALQIVFESAMAKDEGIHSRLAETFRAEYESFSKRSYSVSGGQRGPSGGSFRLERR